MTDPDHPPHNPADPEWDALARFIADECSPAEREELERGLEADAVRASFVHALDAALRVPEPAPPTESETEAALARVRGRAMDVRSGAGTRRISEAVLNAYRSRWRAARLAAAAAVLVVAGAGLIWRTAVSPRSARVPAGPTATYATAVGVLDSFPLPDESRVLLGPGSQISLAPDFGVVTRELTLKGDARFAVAHDASRPFIVHIGAMSVQDVGTVFVVRGDEAGGTRVVVTSGAVSVRSRPGSAAVALQSGDRLRVGPHGTVRIDRGSATSDDLAWMSGRLVFRDASVAQVSADLRRWYGIELRVDSALASRRLSATFDRDAPVAVVGQIVAATLGGALRAEGSVLEIVTRTATIPAK